MSEEVGESLVCSLMQAVDTFKEHLSGVYTIAGVDNVCAASALVKCSSANPTMGMWASQFMEWCADNKISLFYDYVKSELNISDGWSRNGLTKAFRKQFPSMAVSPACPDRLIDVMQSSGQMRRKSFTKDTCEWIFDRELRNCAVLVVEEGVEPKWALL